MPYQRIATGPIESATGSTFGYSNIKYALFLIAGVLGFINPTAINNKNQAVDALAIQLSCKYLIRSDNDNGLL